MKTLGDSMGISYINELGFFFFFRMAVDVSSSCELVSIPRVLNGGGLVEHLSSRRPRHPCGCQSTKSKTNWGKDHTGGAPSSCRECDPAPTTS